MKSLALTTLSLCLAALWLAGKAPPVVTKPPDPAVPAKTAPVVQSPSTAPMQTAPVALPPNAPLPVSMNLRLWHGLLIADVAVNGTFEHFCIDTGLDANVITPAAMTRLNIPEGKAKVRVRILDREVEATETSWKSLQAGLLRLENVPAAQLDVLPLLTHTMYADAPTGWLGTPFLSAFQVTFDISRRVMTLEKPEAKMPKGAMTVPMTLLNGRIFVGVTVPKSKPFQALLDTGAVMTLIPAAAGEKLKLPATEVVKLRAAGGKEVKATLVMIPLISVGRAEWKPMRVAYLSDDAAPGFDRNTAVLGQDFLSHFRVVLNFTAKKAAFIPLTPPDESTGTPRPNVDRPK